MSPVETTSQSSGLAPFSAFAGPSRPTSPLRQAIRAAIRRPEPECVPPLIEQASLDALSGKSKDPQ